MIKRISFENFKAFNKGKISIKPITILLGANNVGKSSIIQLLLMIEQTASYYKKYTSALRLNGEYVKLGEAGNIFTDMKSNLPLNIELELEGKEFQDSVQDISNYVHDYVIEKFSILNRIRLFLVKAEVKADPHEFRSSRERIGGIEIQELISNASQIQRDLKIKYKNNPDLLDEVQNYLLRSYGGRINLEEITNYNFNEANDIISLLRLYEENISSKLIIAYNIVFSERDNRLLVKGISIGTDKITYLKYSFDKKHFLFSDLDKENFMGKYRISVGKKIKFSTIFELIPISEDQPPFHYAFRLRLRRSKDLFSDTIYSLIQLIVSKLRTAFDSELINYVNPLRAFPRRYYFLDRSNISHSLNTIDGDNLTEILKEDKLVRDKVNKWLEKFDLKVTVNAIQDVIHQINVHQHGLNLDLTDVGFGLSQILPVIVQGFLSKKNSLTIIEQPEIHLHPKMQAELADLFIDIIYNSEHRPDRYLLVETHSEYILKRIRRRIAEKKLNYEDVSIYFIQPRTSKSDYAEIQEIEIDKGGAFKWPREFYEEDLEDTIQFLKHQTVEN